jgi:hypothetical protein
MSVLKIAIEAMQGLKFTDDPYQGPFITTVASNEETFKSFVDYYCKEEYPSYFQKAVVASFYYTIKLMKRRFDGDNFHERVSKAVPGFYKPAKEFLEDYLDNFPPLDMDDIIRIPESFTDIRNGIFNAIGLGEAFNNAKVVDTRTVVTNEIINGVAVDRVNKYSLVTMKASELNRGLKGTRADFDLFAFRAYDSTHEDKVYNIVVWQGAEFCKKGKYNALEAVAYAHTTCWKEGDVEAIFRQGDIYLVKGVEGAQINRGKDGRIIWRHFTAAEWFGKLRQQS